MTDQPTERRPLPDPDDPRTDEPYTIQPDLPNDDDGEGIHPEDTPRQGEDDRPLVSGPLEAMARKPI
jgi:hypothetical protein